MDGYAAVKYVYENADHLGIDRDRICLMGTSGGGTICGGINYHLALKNESKMVKFVLLDNSQFWSDH